MPPHRGEREPLPGAPLLPRLLVSPGLLGFRVLLCPSRLIPNALGIALSHLLFFMVFSLHFHGTLIWIKKLECVRQKASRALIHFCCHGGTNVFPSQLRRMGSAKDLPGFIFINISSLSTGAIASPSPWQGPRLCSSPSVPTSG